MWQRTGYKGRMLKRLYLVVALLGFGLTPALATVASAWVDMKPVRYRMLVAQVQGQAYAALQMQLKPGWHTYWRYPGASGISPEFNFADSQNVTAGEALFPAPSFFDDGVGGFYGYEGETGVVFPIRYKGAATLKLQAFLGVCREVCIPLNLALSLDMPEKSQSQSGPQKIIAGLLAAQAKAPHAGLTVEGASFDGVSLQLVVTGQDLQNPYVMSVPGPHDILGPPRTAARHPAAHLIEIPAWSKLDHPFIGRKLTFLVRDGAKAIEQEVEITDHRLLPRVHPHTD